MSSKNNNTEIIDEDKIQKQIETIKSNIEKLKDIDTSIVINIELDEKYSEQAKEIQKKADELNKLQVELAVDSGQLTATEKKVKEFESNVKYLEIEKILLEVELDDNNDTLEAQLQNKIEELDKQISSQYNEKNIIQFKAYLDDTDFQAHLSSLSTYVTNFTKELVSLLNTDIDIDLNTLKGEYEAELNQLEEKYENQKTAYNEYLAEMTESREAYYEHIGVLEDERDELESQKQEIMTEKDYLALQEQIANKEEQIEEQKNIYADLEESHAQVLASQEQAEIDYAEAKLELEQNYQIEKATMERKAAENSKAVAIFSATISMLQAIMQATLTGLQAGFPLALGFVPVFTALAATTGALQIAAISKEPLPEIPTFATGGYIGAEYADNYKPFGLVSPNGIDNTLAWLSTGERVLTPEQNYAYEKMLLGNYNTNNSKSDISNTYNVSVNVAKTNTSSKEIAKAVVKAIGGKM